MTNMIEQPNANVALTFEQLQQIDTAQNRLKNLESEIAIANRNLGIVNKDVVKATKEREYQEELKANVEKSFADKQAEHETLKQSLAEMNDALTESREEIITNAKKHSDKTLELENREKAVVQSETEVAKKLAELKTESDKHNEMRSKIESAQKAFSEATKTVVW